MQIDVTNTIKAVELLKVELLQKVTDMFGDIAAEADSDTFLRIADDAANLINLVYLLSARLGVKYDDIVVRMREKLQDGIAQQHILERKFGDLSELLKSLEEG